MIGRITLSLFAFACGLLIEGTQAQEPTRTYPFPVKPFEALDQLQELKLGNAPKIGIDELSVLNQIAQVKLASQASSQNANDYELEIDALLVASEELSAERRKAYHDKINSLVSEARKQISDDVSIPQQAEALMAFLHKGVMKEGYAEDQTLLTAVLDHGTFNCVSSTAMFYAISHPLKMQLRIISIPGTSYTSGHACLDLIDAGKTYEVEPTNPDGFDSATKLAQPGVIAIGFQPDRKQGHFIDAIGLAAAIYSNRAIAVAKDETDDSSLLAISLGLRGLVCDPLDPTVASNTIATISNWGLRLSKQGRYEDSLKVFQFGWTITADTQIRHNWLVTSVEQIRHLIQLSKDQEAQAAIERGKTNFADESYFQKSACWTQAADQALADQGIAAATKLITRALTVTPVEDRVRLEEHQISLYARWSAKMLEEQDIDGSLESLQSAFLLQPQNPELHQAAAYHVQEALGILLADKAGTAAENDHFRKVSAVFSELAAVQDAGRSHAIRTIQDACSQNDFATALTLAEGYKPLATSKPQAEDFAGMVYCLWGQHLAEKHLWTEAIEKLKEGIDKPIQSEDLINSALHTIDQWAELSMTNEDWTQAIKVYDRGLEYFPGNQHLQNNRDYCISKQKQ